MSQLITTFRGDKLYITGILAATRGIKADTALRLARYFGTTPQFWLNLQRNYDLRRAEAEVGAHIREEIAALTSVPTP